MGKKILALVLALLLVLSMAGCDEKGEIVEQAVDALRAAWTEYFAESAVENDGYLQVANTRLITLRENSVSEMRNVAYVVEFLIYADYYGAAPYYAQVTGLMDTVTVYKDGTVSVGSNPLKAYSQKTYSWDYSAFVESVEDLGDAYNFAENLQ